MRYFSGALCYLILALLVLTGGPAAPSASAAPLAEQRLEKKRVEARKSRKAKRKRNRGRTSPVLTNPIWDNPAGYFTLNGKPAFPRGFYYVSYYQQEKARRLTDLQKIAAAGFNLLLTPIDTSDAQLFQRAKELDVHLMMEFNDDPTTLLRQFGREPALGFLSTFDDVDSLNANGTPRFPVDLVARQTTAYKLQAPKAQTYVSGGHPQRIKNYLWASDTIGYQSYPIPLESLSSLTTGYLNPMLSTFQAAKQPVIANLQTFPWFGRYRYPTPVEVRNMTYQALVAGVQGVLYYTYYDQYTDLNKQPALWTELRKLGGELKGLEQFLAGGKRTTFRTGQSELFAAKWRVGTDLIVAVVNAGTGSKTVSLSLGENLTGTISNRFTNRTGRLQLQNGALRGTMPAQDVQVYKLGVR